MRVFRGSRKHPLDLLAISNEGFAATCSELGGGSHIEVVGLAKPTVWTHCPAIDDILSYVFAQTKSLAFTPDGRFLLVGELRSITVLNVTTRQPESGSSVVFNHPEFVLSASGRLLVIETRNQNSRLTCYVSDGPVFTRTWAVGPTEFVGWYAPAISADGQQAAVVKRSAVGPTASRQTIELRDGDTGKIQRVIPTDAADAVRQLVFTADGSKLLARTDSRTVTVFDTVTGEPAGELVHKRRPYVSGLAVHPGGKVIATSRNDGTVWFWDAVTLREMRSFNWKLGKLVSVAFSPDGMLAAAGTEDGQVIVWDVDL